MRFTDYELGIIKVTFKDNDILLMTLRKFFLQGELTNEEKDMVRNFGANKPAVAVLKKTLLPEIDPNAPLFQLVDIWLNVETNGSNPEKAYFEMQSRQIVKEYLEIQFKILNGENVGMIDLKSLEYNKNKGAIEAFVDLGARNLFLILLEKLFQELKNLAELKEETEEERNARLKKESME